MLPTDLAAQLVASASLFASHSPSRKLRFEASEYRLPERPVGGRRGR